MKCPVCNSSNPAGSRFCESCGSRLEAEAPASPQPAMQHTAPSPNPESAHVAHKPVNVTPVSPAPAPYTAHPIPAAASRDNPVSFGAWIGTLIILMIPFVNLIMLLVWALGPNVNRSLQNYCRAILLLGFIVMIFSALLFLIILLMENSGGLQW